MSQIIKNLKGWQFLTLATIMFLVGCFAVGQAITFSWLSSFPEQMHRLEVLKVKFWAFIFIAFAAFIITGISLVQTVRLKKTKAVESVETRNKEK